MTRPCIIAHRGFADQFPENTAKAIRRSASHVDMVEVDVRRCGTGELVGFHDATLNRVTGASGRIDETPLAALRDLTVGDSRESIATLSELLTATPANVRVNLELKEPGIVDDAMSTCERYDMDVIYSSFHDEAIENVRDRRADAPVAVLCHESEPVIDRLQLAMELDAEALHPSLELVDEWRGPDTSTLAERLNIRMDALDPGVVPSSRTTTESSTEPNRTSAEPDRTSTGTDIISVARALELRVNVWTAKSPADVDDLAQCGVDGVMVDHADLVTARS